MSSRSVEADRGDGGAALRRVKAEYGEMPGLRLTVAQARRLFGLDQLACDSALQTLTDARILSRLPDGSFVKAESIMVASRPEQRRRGA